MITIKIFDGAFGTYYMAQTGQTGFCELANLTDKDRVLAIHRAYINSGAAAIKTNTFRANAESFPDTLESVITEGYALAQKAAEGTNVDVYADIGYVSEEDAAEALYWQVAEIFLALGAKRFLFETLSSFKGVAAVAERIKNQVPDAHIIVSFTVSQDGYSSKGIYYKQLIKEAGGCPFTDAVGLNCTCGPAHLLYLTRGLGDVTKPLCIMPNAGYPAVVNGRTVFNDNPGYFGEKLAEIVGLGVEIVGGCCGTTPEHIRVARESIAAISSEGGQLIVPRSGVNVRGAIRPTDAALREGEDCNPVYPAYTARPAAAPCACCAPPTRVKTAKPIYVELDPPPDCDNTFLFDSTDRLKALGVSAITLADSPLSRPRADSVLTAARLKSVKDIDVLPHITCRDKNATALKGTLLGAYAFGINKVLIVTGDRPAQGGVFSFNALTLMDYVNNLNRELFYERPFAIGGALNVNAVHFDAELHRAERKIANGATFLLTQPIFSEEAVNNFIRAGQTLGCALFAGILPVVGYKNAVFLNNEVAGIKIPPGVVESFADKKNAAETSLRLSAEIIQAVSPYAHGFYIMTPLKKIGPVCALMERCFNG